MVAATLHAVPKNYRDGHSLSDMIPGVAACVEREMYSERGQVGRYRSLLMEL